MDFEAFAKTALGTDDPERIAAFREAVMSCMNSSEEGEYEEGAATGEGDAAALLFGGG